MQDSDLRYDLVNVLEDRRFEKRWFVPLLFLVSATGFEPRTLSTNDKHARPLDHAATPTFCDLWLKFSSVFWWFVLHWVALDGIWELKLLSCLWILLLLWEPMICSIILPYLRHFYYFFVVASWQKHLAQFLQTFIQSYLCTANPQGS
jgi:hypothetical protein